jgi:putative protease
MATKKTEKAVEKKLSALKKCGINIALCSTLDAVAIARKLGFTIHGGFSLNVFNQRDLCDLKVVSVNYYNGNF